jgi:ankyrin repeat protein
MAAAVRKTMEHTANDAWRFADEVRPESARRRGGSDAAIGSPTTLHRAAERGDLAGLEQLLAAGGDANGPDEDGKRPLHWAKSADVARLLLRFGADVTAASTVGYTALHSAVRTGRAGVVQVLLGHGADVNAKPPGYRLTPLHVAVDDGRIELAETLLDHGADVNAVDGVGLTPLAMAAERGYQKLVKVLIRRGGVLGPQAFE